MNGNYYTQWQYDQSHNRHYCYYWYRGHGGWKYNVVLCYPPLSPYYGYYYFVKPLPGPDVIWSRCVNQNNPVWDPGMMKWQHRPAGVWIDYQPPGFCPTPGDGIDPITDIPDPPIGEIPHP